MAATLAESTLSQIWEVSLPKVRGQSRINSFLVDAHLVSNRELSGNMHSKDHSAGKNVSARQVVKSAVEKIFNLVFVR